MNPDMTIEEAIQTMHTADDVLTEAQIADITQYLGMANVLYIKGTAYTLDSYSDPDELGNRTATLSLFRPF